MILGGVPIIVLMPPNMLPKATGINTMAGERLFALQVAMATGSNRANAPTLFINAEKNVTTHVNRAICTMALLE